MNLKSNFLVGPTASGKSEIAHQLAIKNNQCIVSADSMNVYRCMNIGTAKPPEKYLNEINYYGVDIIDFTNSFSVMHWKKSVEKAWKRKKYSYYNWRNRFIYQMFIRRNKSRRK